MRKIVIMMNFLDLPEECIATVISYTTPYDACRICAVSKTLHSIADSDTVWEKFLPSDARLLVDHSLSTFSNKQLFLRFCESPLLIDDGKASFWLEKSGKKCLMVSSKKLEIVWVNSPDYWIWISIPDSRFEEVAALLMVCWFEIRGRINTLLLSKDTLYGAYLVFKEGEGAFGFKSQPLETSFRSPRADIYDDGRVFRETGYASSRPREDGWLEIELGEYYVGFEEEELEMSVLETREGGWKGGIIVQGIEIRPK